MLVEHVREDARKREAGERRYERRERGRLADGTLRLCRRRGLELEPVGDRGASGRRRGFLSAGSRLHGFLDFHVDNYIKQTARCLSGP